MPGKDFYQSCVLPKDLSFDEESLFWRLRLGEGIPNRQWHKPLDRTKTWHQVKYDLDKKIASSRTSTIFHKVFPLHSPLINWFYKFIKILKISFLLEDN